jgi:predicted aconitase with swiveling domain
MTFLFVSESPIQGTNVKPRVLFILKYRESSGGSYSNCWSQQDEAAVGAKKELSSGLLNSARFIVDMLRKTGIAVELVQVVDNNDIDREVTRYKPTHVVIEALWVVPSKFDVLQRLHPHVQWIVRGHSELPFLAQEGVAVNWITKYVQFKNVKFAANSEHSVRDIRAIIKAANPTWSHTKVAEKVPYLPNYYPHDKKIPAYKKPESKFIDVACFGAIRPLKNQLVQAVAAIEYANLEGKILRFHTNATRVETQGDSVLKNLEALFEATPPHQLIKHSWMPHEEFLKLLKQMDVAMQVSFSETFNIVAADCVVTGLPIVVSPEVSWATSWCQAEPTNSEDILLKLLKANDWRLKLAIKVLNLRGLRHFCEDSKSRWVKYLNG